MDSPELLLSAAVRLNTALLATVCGLLGGLLLVAATLVSLVFGGPQPGDYLSLLAVFFPGYSVSWGGLWVAFGWGFFFGGFAGGLIYWIYARTAGTRLGRQYLDTGGNDPVLNPPIMTLVGPALGAALGAVMALQLLVTTNWLVLRGTAEDSVHAALLSNYLPGYSVSVAGSLVGAAQLFATTFCLAALVSTVYNCVVRVRHGRGVAR